jgi:phenylacetaldehyde dehydrogenase
MQDPVSEYLTAHHVPQPHRALLRRDLGHWIDGRMICAGDKIPVIEPSTAAPLATTFEAGAELVDQAVNAACTAFENPDWVDMRPLDRQQMILRLADLIDLHADELALMESLDVGKPVTQAREVDVQGSVDVLRYFAGCATRINGRAGPLAAYDPDHFGMTLRQPVGVVAAIVPWNFPLQTLVWKCAAAFATGCTVVAKPSEISPLSALRFAELTQEAGFPPGVFNLVNGTGPITGAALVAHEHVRKITFTGSTAAGQRIGAAAMGTMKRLTLELGGKCPVLVTQSADLDQAVEGVINGIFFNAGQVCDAGSRLIVEDAVYDVFLARLAQRAQDLTIGAGLKADVFLGPLASRAHHQKVRAFVDLARADGLDLIVDRSDQPGPGFFLGPVIIGDCPPDHPCWTDEIFGPVLVCQRAQDEAALLSAAHATEYGLGAAVFSRDQGQIMRLSRRLKAGTIYVNGHGFLDPAFPFGGQGLSGFGKDLGEEQLDAYLETTSVLFAP